MHFEDLSLRHQTFLSEYVQNGFNASKAYQAVYEDSSEDAARKSASRLMTREDIQKALAERVQAISPDYVLSEIQSIGDKAIRPSDKLRAMELLGKYHALFKETNQNLNLNAQLTADELQAIRQKLPKKPNQAQLEDTKENVTFSAVELQTTDNKEVTPIA